MNAAIVGAGISGLTAARVLKERGYNTTIFEKKDRPGGLIQCDVVDNNLFHKVGGHVFNAKDKIVNDWFWKHFNKDEEFIKADRNAKIWLRGKLIGYPLENHLYSMDEQTVHAVIRDLLEIQKNAVKDPWSYSDFGAFLKGNFGPTLYELYFQPYNSKIWKTDLSTVPMHWLEGKLPMPNIQEIVTTNIARKGEQGMVHSTFFYPKRGGSQFIVDRLSEGLSVKRHAAVTRIERRNQKWSVNGEEGFDIIVYTGDVRTLPSILSDDTLSASINGYEKELSQLRANGTSNMLCHTDKTDLSWLYLPDSTLLCHRIIYTGNFSPANNAPGQRPTCVVEFSGKADEQTMLDQIKLLPGNLTPIARNYEANSYVIQNKNTRDVISGLQKILNPSNFYLTGRFAEWEYYNMDKAILSCLTKLRPDAHAN